MNLKLNIGTGCIYIQHHNIGGQRQDADVPDIFFRSN